MARTFATDGILREILASYAPDGSADIAADFLAAPEPFEVRDRVPVGVRDARRLPDGRAGVVVDICDQISFHIYQQVEGQWLAAEVIELDHPRSSCVLPLISADTSTP